MIDFYWEKIKPQKSYAKFLMYISLFPQLLAGPIVRYEYVEKDLFERRTTLEDMYEGFTRIITGLSKKVIIADNLSGIVDNFFGADISTLSVTGTWYEVILYALRIYFDFSGYSDMAIGLARLFGFRYNENFNYPFVSKSITEFWQRWHISLGTFFRDYLLYVPIFGKRRQYLSLFLVWFCTGLWHGASWNFIIWGLYFGLFIFIERLITKKRMKKIPKVILHIYSKLVIITGFGIFYFEDIKKLGVFFKNFFGLNGNAFADEIVKTSFINNIFLIIAAVVFSVPILDFFKKMKTDSQKAIVIKNSVTLAVNVTLLIISSIMLNNATNHPFLYFRF
jgi:alginate O-acetyltransferase complex protein AlgI